MDKTPGEIIKTIIDFFKLARAPFHLVGILPFAAGSILANHIYGGFRTDVFLLGLAAVILIQAATYLNGEYFDYDVDELSAQHEKNRFSGGSQVLQKGIIPRKAALYAAWAAAIGAILIGLYICFPLGFGWTPLLLGAFGFIAGFFYSSKPFQWAYMGIGEGLIGVCYGWLPVAVAFFLQQKRFHPAVHLCSLPIIFSIFNVIFINEFPDYIADRALGKKTLVVRLGKEISGKFYAVISIITGITLVLALWGLGLFTPLVLLLAAPVLAVAILNASWAFREYYKDRVKLERLCAMTLIVNLGVNILFCVAFLLA
ncbi:MAG: prenyltransferase [Acidobacteriota bacterium]|nr:prenyltransferase [Acidobacteriota bacterium]